MKITTILTTTLLLAVASDVASQRRTRVYDQEDMQARKTHLLAEAWLKNGDWVMSYDQAKAKAKKSGKLIFAYFTRSYAP